MPKGGSKHRSLYVSLDTVYFSPKRQFTFERRFSQWSYIFADLKTDTTLCCTNFQLHQDFIFFEDFAYFSLNSIPVSTDKSDLSFQITALPKRPENNDPDEIYDDLNDRLLFKEYRFIMSQNDFRNIFRKVKAKLGDKMIMDEELHAILADNAQIVPVRRREKIDRKHKKKHVAREINRLQVKAIKDRRGAFKNIPVFFSSDMIHGAWWYAWGSIVSTIVSLVVLLNSFKATVDLGNDDSVLPQDQYRIAWWLCLASSILFTIGSLVFIRACNDPPLPPLIGCFKSFANDEIAGIWFFFLAVLPAFPYFFIFLIFSENIIYLGALIAFAIILVLMGVGIYIAYKKANQPEDQGRRLVRFLTCCVDTDFGKTHLANDWLLGTWLVYWATALGNVLFFLYFFYELIHKSLNNVALFIYIMSVFNGLMFLTGATYFVSGSYPLPEEDEQTAADPPRRTIYSREQCMSQDAHYLV